MKPRTTRLDGLANPSLRNARAVLPAVALVPLYTAGTRCPACASSNWLIGRISAECGQCSYPLLLAHPEKDAWS